MDIMDKLTILADSAKYDVACTSSGAAQRSGQGLGSTLPSGCCHSFSADGRCISLLKVLMNNYCTYDCCYCVNRISNDIPRAAFTPEELADLTIEFYRRNYIEGLFLSSGILKNPDYTTEQIIKALKLLRYKYEFQGYIHAKTIPGTSPHLIEQLGLLADRLSINIELPSEASLKKLAPAKTRQGILAPMETIANTMQQNKSDLQLYRGAPTFASAGQATQMIVGASPESDWQIMRLASGLYKKYDLKRVFYSAYIPVVEDNRLPSLQTKPPLLREHRLYQADWLLRKYKFDVAEILSEDTPNFNPYLDPKCNWAVNNLHLFPVDVNTAPENMLLRIPGVGPTSAKRIRLARRHTRLTLADLKRIGVVLKRAQYFILAADQAVGLHASREATVRALIDPSIYNGGVEQLSWFTASTQGLPGGMVQLPASANLTITEATEEAITCMAKAI